MSAQLVARLDASTESFDAELEKTLDWQGATFPDIEQKVAAIVADVRAKGDQALLRFTKEFDALAADSLDQLRVDADQLAAAFESLPADQRAALRGAAQRIRQYHEYQIESSWSYVDRWGNRLGQKITPLQRVGVYVPGGQASYPSSVLMTLIPARVAGVPELVVTTPTPRDEVNQMVLGALHVAGVDEVIRAGGAQAIAALAFGTESLSRVDKIVGPGGAFVAEAKRQVFGRVGIDIIAGPSEVLVVADGSTDPEWTAIDLFSQAEHDAAAQSILVSTNDEFLNRVEASMHSLLPRMQRREIIEESLRGRGAFIKAADKQQACEIANRIAPEHLELHVEHASDWVDAIHHAGAIFCGSNTGETFGDYVAGPSHVLPTFGTARFGSPLGVYDFVKRSSVIDMSSQGVEALADIAQTLAESEGLQAHGLAASMRMKQR